MDIQKEKIAHEKHLLSQGVDFKYLPNIQYSELENVYELIEWDEEYSEALNEINSSWCTWQAATAQAAPEQTLTSDCMINKLWFMKGTPVANLIKHAEEVYKAEVIAQNSKIKFGTDDNEVWWAHDVPYYGEVQMDWIKEDQEWDIFFNGCWQGPFNTKEECIKHLEECIAEQRAEAQEQSHD